MDALPLPEHPVLRAAAEQLEHGRFTAEVWDEQWRLAYLTADYRLSAGASPEQAQVAVGEPVHGARYAELRSHWPGGGDQASWRATLERMLPMIAHDLPGGFEQLEAELDPALHALLTGLSAQRSASLLLERGEIRFGSRTTPFVTIGTRLHDVGGSFVGTTWIVLPALSGSTLSLLGTGDHRSLERLLSIRTPDRRPGAVLFVDLEGSTALARTLPAAAYFRLVRRMMSRIDDEIVSRGGLVGKHAGDGATAFFLSELYDGESATARACIGAARAIRAHGAEIADRSGLEPGAVTLRFGLHWGATLYVGRLLTSGRAEVTALGDEVNETARIEACASGGRALASKGLIERLDAGDLAALGLDGDALRFTTLGDLPAATEKARRDAPAIAVCEL